MPSRVDASIIEAARTEYISSSTRPSLRELADRYGISLRTLARYSTREEWIRKREAHWQRVARGVAEQTEAEAHRAIEAEKAERDRTVGILKFVRDGLVRAYNEAMTRMVKGEELAPEQLVEIERRWQEMSTGDLVRFITACPRAISETVRALEELEGRRMRVEGKFTLQSSEIEPREMAELILRAVTAETQAHDGAG